MRHMRKWIALVLCLCMFSVSCLSLTGCCSVGDGKKIIRIAHSQSETHPEHLGLLKFKEYVEENLGDKYEVQIYPNELLGSQKKAIELTQTGAIDFTLVGTPNLENFADVYEVFSMPYLFTSEEAYHAAMMDTDYMDKVKKFCNNVAFKETYIFFSNKGSDHTRECTCTRCGKSWITTENVKHKSETVCPKCKSKALWWAERYEHCIRNITTIVTPYKKANQLILRWAVVARRFSGQKPLIAFEDGAYTFYLNEKGKQKIVSYFKTNSYYASGEFTKAFINQTCYHDAYVYTGDLKRTFGDKYYNVNFSEVLKNQYSPMNFIGLLDNLKNYPQTEYLCKMGLASLASYFIQTDFFNDGCKIKRQYLDMYRNMGVTVPEHRIINSTDWFVHENDLKEIRWLHKAGMTYDCLQQAVQYQRPDIVHDYLLRQKAITGAPISHINYWLRDYYNMCDSLDVPIMGQTARPKNLKKAHDIILKRYNEVKNQIDAEKSKAALEIVNQWFKGYEKDGMCIQVPHERVDFIREGQALSHCVGGERYYKNHIAGSQMIFFIRKAALPDKPFVTCEIDMRTGMVLQCYGFGDSVPPKEVKRFAKDFARFIQSRISVVRKAG